MVLWQTLLGIAILFVWQGVSGRLIDNFFISNPIDVGQRLIGWTLDGSIFTHLWATIYATMAGFAIGSVLGGTLGIWLGVSPFISRLLNPYLNGLNALPKVALAPLFVLWFGLGIESKIALAAALVLFLVFLNTFAGVRQVDQDLIEIARLMKATRLQVIAKVIVPSAMSWMFAGLRVSVPYALIGAVIGEMVASNKGLRLSRSVFGRAVRHRRCICRSDRHCTACDDVEFLGGRGAKSPGTMAYHQPLI